MFPGAAKMTLSPARTYREQLRILEERGLRIADDEVAIRHLSHLNYYRFKLYGEPYFDAAGGRYHPEASFDDILKLYRFDQRLRELVLAAIKRVEVSVRSRLAYEIGHRLGPFAHLDTTSYRSAEQSLGLLGALATEFRRSKEDFLRPYRDAGGLDIVPVWVAVEVASFGVISKMLSAQGSAALRQAVADSYGLDEKVLCAAMHHLNVARNVAAHHGRLWGRRFSIELSIPRKKPAYLAGAFAQGPDRAGVYNTLVMLVHLVRQIDGGSDLPSAIRSHLLQLDPKLWSRAGIPDGWSNHPTWMS